MAIVTGSALIAQNTSYQTVLMDKSPSNEQSYYIPNIQECPEKSVVKISEMETKTAVESKVVKACLNKEFNAVLINIIDTKKEK